MYTWYREYKIWINIIKYRSGILVDEKSIRRRNFCRIQDCLSALSMMAKKYFRLLYKLLENI